MSILTGTTTAGSASDQPATGGLTVLIRERADDATRQFSEKAQQLAHRAGTSDATIDPRWFSAVCDGLGHKPFLLQAERDGQVVALLPLAFLQTCIFGRFLVSLPYVNSAGTFGADGAAVTALIDRAVELADELNVRHLELRHERQVEHPALSHQLSSKVHMRLGLPSSAGTLWKSFKPKVRNQVRKGETHEFRVHWGREDLLADFHAVFSRNMRDLGTPVFGKRLFRSILTAFGGDAELCVVRDGRRPIAGAMLVHGSRTTSVPSASSLRKYNPTNANMLMYWKLLERCVQRGQAVFDFGRSTIDSNTYRFKKQWGAQPEPAVWQYYVRTGGVDDMRPDNERNQKLIAIWRRLPVWLTRLMGPSIVRGIP